MSTTAQLHPIPVACQRLGIGRSGLYDLMNSGELHSVKIGRRRLVPESAIADYIARLVGGSDAA
ncbi:helix-turn-helix domain-containing protein [Nocardia fusca]|uniref:helix-turn-helix domain-containing protein n=1 Tax=Nocardia fusca TaxID=941183 RepID=UPI0007A755E2|nr:helix-turn-helix domain-containing protein [Nocardia fusca]